MGILSEEDIVRCANAVKEMDKYMQECIKETCDCNDKKKLWENTYISKQISLRRDGKKHFSLEEHIRGMIYAMLTNGAPWERIVRHQDCKTGMFPRIDEIFHDYDPEFFSGYCVEELEHKITGLKCGSQYIERQLRALPYNIKMLREFERRSSSGYIDDYYEEFKGENDSLDGLIRALSTRNEKLEKDCKLRQMAEALNAEYLRNIGYDIAKPDRHIRRILGIKCLGCSDKEEVGIYKAMDIVREIAVKFDNQVAKVDYILWSYCANCFGQICTKNNPRCDECVAKDYCKRGKE